MDKAALRAGLARASLGELVAIYEGWQAAGVSDDAQTCAAVVQRTLSLGEPLLAYDAGRLAMQEHSGNRRLAQLQGLSLARCGALDQALATLGEMYEAGARDEETLGILARVYKDVWQQRDGSAAGAPSLRKSLELYLAAFRSSASYWAGINAATLACASGQRSLAMELARAVTDSCLAAEKGGGEADVWRRATLGEAALLLGDADGARRWYEAALAAGARHGDAASMRRNARLALAATGKAQSWLEAALPSPVIAVFSGHRVDAHGRASPRFPEEMADSSAAAIKAWLVKHDVQIGYASAAAGGDILFHEALAELGRESHVVLPAPPEQFARESVAGSQSAWFARFRRVLDRAAGVTVHSNSSSGDIGYVYNNWLVLGLARLRARQIEARLKALALWDGNDGLAGGTSSAVRDWQGFGQDVEWLPPGGRHASTRAGRSDGTGTVARSLGSQRIVSLLFGDAVGFSKLADESVPAFVEHFLGTVARVLARQPQAALTRNTWGDGLYFSFANPRDAGMFALDLCDAVRATDWTDRGLPATLSLRIALHCGPAHEVIDPVVGQRNYTGAHVSRAARIEPVTPPGSVYASQSFAALCECEGIREFACEYVGRMPLAKKYGEYPTFSVRRRSS